MDRERLAMRKVGGHTLIELVVALVIGSVVLYGVVAGVRFFTRPTEKAELTLDQIRGLQLGAEKLDRDLRDARQIIYPTPGASPSRILYFRDFTGSIVAYYFNPPGRELRRITFALSPSELPTEPQKAPVSDLDDAYFTVNPVGLVSWGLFAPGRVLLGSVKRENQ